MRDVGAKTTYPLKGKAVESNLRPREVVEARRLLCQLAAQGVGQSGAEGAPFVGVTTAVGGWSAVSPDLPEFRKYPKAL
jgi:hypothetical protein